MTGRLGMTGTGVGYGNTVFGKAAPKRIPFLHPKARPFHIMDVAARHQANPRNLETMSRLKVNPLTGQPKKIAPLMEMARHAPSGPKAPQKVLRALSGPDYETTMGRLGRATRRQKKEFSAMVHPLSGRVMGMTRGGPINAAHDVSALQTRSMQRMAHLADNAKNPEVRARAKANIMGTRTNAVGPRPVMVHNHPTEHRYGPHNNRAYPSGMDLMGAVQAHAHRHAVISHVPGPRGSKQTKVVHTRITNPQQAQYVAPEIAAHDTATLPKHFLPHALRGAGMSRREGMEAKREAQRYVMGRRKNKGQKPRPYDAEVRHRTTGDHGEINGIHTQENFYKALAAPIFTVKKGSVIDLEEAKRRRQKREELRRRYEQPRQSQAESMADDFMAALKARQAQVRTGGQVMVPRAAVGPLMWRGAALGAGGAAVIVAGRRAFERRHQQGSEKLAKREDEVKTTMSQERADELARRYDTRGTLPKKLPRDKRMEAYEARYIASGGRKAEKWKRRANAAETSRNVGLVGATAAGGALLATRGKRVGPLMARTAGLRHLTPRRLETAALASGVGGGWSELYGEHARSRRASYANSPAGVAASALTRMRNYTPGGA